MIIRLIQRTPHVPDKTGGSAVVSARLLPLCSLADVADAVALHTGPYDVPMAQTDVQRRHAYADYAAQHLRGYRLYQVELETNGLDAPGTPRQPEDSITDDTLVVGQMALVRLIAAPRRAVLDAMASGVVTTITSLHRGQPYRYAALDARMQAWCRRYTRWMPLTAERMPRTSIIRPGAEPQYATVADVVAAARRGAFPVREPSEEQYEYLTGYDYLLWAAAQRPEEERRQILAAVEMEEAV